jgi:hypothetical protein
MHRTARYGDSLEVRTLTQYPKPDNERIRRNAPTFTWTNLPARNDAPVPPLPVRTPDQNGNARVWSDRTAEAWERLWRSPQSTQWTDAQALMVEQWITLYEALITGVGGQPSAIASSMAVIGDRLGLSPKALLQLRWRIAPADDPPVLAAVADIKRSTRRDPRTS